jgi:hypothetical protein
MSYDIMLKEGLKDTMDGAKTIDGVVHLLLLVTIFGGDFSPCLKRRAK